MSRELVGIGGGGRHVRACIQGREASIQIANFKQNIQYNWYPFGKYIDLKPIIGLSQGLTTVDAA